jgi:hypothetical protein
MVQPMETELEEEQELSDAYPRSKRGPNGEFQCRFCPEDDFQGGLQSYNHERTFHPDQLKAASTTQAGRSKKETPRSSNSSRNGGQNGGNDGGQDSRPTVEVIGGVRMDTVTELTRKFARALHDTAPDMAGAKKKGIIMSFDEHSYNLNGNPNLLERFLNRCALTTSQVEYIKLMMLGMRDDSQSNNQWANGSSWGNWGNSGNGSPMAMTLDPRTGNMVPMPIFMMGGQGGPTQSAPPIMFMPPWGGGGYQRDEDRLTKSEVARMLDEALEKRERRSRQDEQPSSNRPVRRHQEIVGDAQGNPMRDQETGEILTVWVEEPVDPTSNTIELLKSVGAIGQREIPTPPTAQEIAAALKDALPQQKDTDPEVLELRKEFQEYVRRTELRDAREEAARAAVEQTMANMKPYLDELKDLKGQTGLSEHQYELKHQETLQNNILTAMRDGFSGIRGDLQPLMIQMMAANLKGAGLSDNAIGDLLQRIQQPNGHASSSESNEPAETMRRWIKE